MPVLSHPVHWGCSAQVRLAELGLYTAKLQDTVTDPQQMSTAATLPKAEQLRTCPSGFQLWVLEKIHFKMSKDVYYPSHS